MNVQKVFNVVPPLHQNSHQLSLSTQILNKILRTNCHGGIVDLSVVLFALGVFFHSRFWETMSIKDINKRFYLAKLEIDWGL